MKKSAVLAAALLALAAPAAAQNISAPPGATGVIPGNAVVRDANGNAFANSFVSSGQSIATAGATTILTAASPRYTVFTGSSSQTLVMPDATTLSANNASSFYVNNNSSGTITINANGGGLIYSLPAGGYAQVNLLTNSVAAGTWDVHPLAPSITAWSSGATGLQMNNALNTTAQIGSGASSCTAPNIIPQRANSTTGFGSSGSTNVCGVVAGTTAFTATTTLFSLPAGSQFGINGAGIPYFSGTLSGAPQTVTSAQWTKVLLDSVVDPNSWWNATNHNYVPQLAGKYEICGGVYANGTTVTVMFGAIAKNGIVGTGTTVAKGNNVAPATTATDAVSIPCQIVTVNGTTDTLELDANITGTGTVSVNNDFPTSFFIRWLGP